MPFRENIDNISARIYEFLKDKQEATSWQIKLSLNLSSSTMYLALGSLMQSGKITIEPDGINYKIAKTPQQN